MLNFALLAVAAALFATLTFAPWFRRSDEWAATVTPLASIMGSGFLVCGPLLAATVGLWTPVAMLGLLAVAYAIGGAIRFNIREIQSSLESTPGDGDGDGDEGGDEGGTDESHGSDGIDHRLHGGHRDAPTELVRWLATVSQIGLAVAYVVSVTYYVMLLSQFVLKPLGVADGQGPTLLATAVLGAIAAVGFFFGLKVVERVERAVVSANLAVIGTLLVGLAWHNGSLWVGGDWSLPSIEPMSGRWTMLRTVMGLLIVVQGFETSRYLGGHPAEQRIRTMRTAQLIASAVYLVFLSLLLVVLTPDSATTDAGVTAIIGLVGVVAGVLPALLTIAAAGSQFSAAAADEAGCGGLLERLVPKLNARTSYLAIGGLTIALAWTVNVMQVIAIASRVFAAFYALQCAIAAIHAWRTGRRALGGWFGLLAAIAAAVAALGKSTE